MNLVLLSAPAALSLNSDQHVLTGSQTEPEQCGIYLRTVMKSVRTTARLTQAA